MGGDHLIVCDRTGFVFKRSECREEWNGLLVHKSVWEPRHPQDVLRPKPDNQSVDIARPEPRDPPQGTAFNIGNVI